MLDDGGKANEVLSPHACCKQKGAFLEGVWGNRGLRSTTSLVGPCAS